MGTTITINYVYINPNNTLYKGDWLTNYFFGVDMTIYGDIPHEFTLIMYLGKDQNSLVEILRSTITYDTLPPVLYPSFIIEFYGTVFWSYGYRTVDDLLNKAGVSNLTSCVFCVRVIWGSGESSKCTTVTIVQPTPPTVTINNVYLTRDGYTTNNMYRGESLDRYAIYFDVTVGSTTGVSVNIIVRAGKDQNNLKTIGGYGQTLTSGTYVIPMRIFSTIYPTTDDFLNSIGATDSCVICVTIS